MKSLVIWILNVNKFDCLDKKSRDKNIHPKWTTWIPNNAYCYFTMSSIDLHLSFVNNRVKKIKPHGFRNQVINSFLNLKETYLILTSFITFFFSKTFFLLDFSNLFG